MEDHDCLPDILGDLNLRPASPVPQVEKTDIEIDAAPPDEHVLGVNIAVVGPGLVDRLECYRERVEHMHGFEQWEPPIHPPAAHPVQRFALDEFADEAHNGLALDHRLGAVDVLDDRRAVSKLVQATSVRTKLLLGRGAFRVEDLDRPVDVRAALHDSVDFALRAPAEFALHGVLCADDLAGLEVEAVFAAEHSGHRDILAKFSLAPERRCGPRWIPCRRERNAHPFQRTGSTPGACPHGFFGHARTRPSLGWNDCGAS